MPLYRTGPDLSIDDLIVTLESRGEPIVTIQSGDSGEWIVVTAPKRPTTITTAFGATETRS